jgi:L-seryl-tRNA(Ser) seleniumtransferase
MSHKNNPERKKLLAALPSVDSILESETGKTFATKIRREVLADLARDAVAAVRADILKQKPKLKNEKEVARQTFLSFEKTANSLMTPSMRKVINCTGVILHTGLGRAVIPRAAIESVETLIGGYMNLEIDLETGKRGDRSLHVEKLICLLTGAEAACVVNNNAAAVLVALNSLANRREVVISRGELVEIGGSFRIPDVMKKSGAKMVEVGTTNKTHRSDFQNAISPKTAGFLHVHTSNYRVQGFTAHVPLPELVELAHRNDLFVLHDLGGGILVDLRDFGLPYEPVVQESVAAGVDVVTFSGDKVLGGPQSGILVGKKDSIGEIKRNPLMRALRCDKLTYAILENTLRFFLATDQLWQEHEVLRMLSEPADNVELRAEKLLQEISPIDSKYQVEIVKSSASAGSGALPLEKISSFALSIRVRNGSINSLARQLRTSTPAVFGYTQKDTLFLDMRTVLANDFAPLETILTKILGKN